jgi:hypothetical protein
MGTIAGMSRIFLLSPADCGGLRAQMVMRAGARFDLACRLRGPAGAPLGEVFTFLSGLYFRGKLAYARAFAAPPAPELALGGGVYVITPGAGLQSPDAGVTVEVLRAFARVDIDAGNPGYCRPLVTSAEALARRIGPECDVVLLGSIASAKYVDVLASLFAQGLSFPADFVGRGDMSRGGLLLRCVAAGKELDYVPVAGAIRRGPRPPKLPPLRRPRPVAEA